SPVTSSDPSPVILRERLGEGSANYRGARLIHRSLIYGRSPAKLGDIGGSIYADLHPAELAHSRGQPNPAQRSRPPRRRAQADRKALARELPDPSEALRRFSCAIELDDADCGDPTQRPHPGEMTMADF